MLRDGCTGSARGLKDRGEHVFRDLKNFKAHDDDRFRFSRAVLSDLCAERGQVLERPTRQNHSLLVQVQILTTLGFLATCCYKRELADRYVYTMFTCLPKPPFWEWFTVTCHWSASLSIFMSCFALTISGWMWACTGRDMRLIQVRTFSGNL